MKEMKIKINQNQLIILAPNHFITQICVSWILFKYSSGFQRDIFIFKEFKTHRM